MTKSSDKRFRYTLGPLLKKRRMDWTWVKVEEVNAKAVVDQHDGELKGIQGVIGETEGLLRRSCEPGASIDPNRQQGLATYLAVQHGDLAEKREQLERASKVHEQINRNLNSIRQGIKALEKHQAKKESEFATEAVRLEHNQVDELWLIGNKGAGATGVLRKTAMSYPHPNLLYTDVRMSRAQDAQKQPPSLRGGGNGRRLKNGGDKNGD